MGARHHVHLSHKDRIGAYEIRDLRGQGHIAAVYECVHSMLGRPAAIKLMHQHLAHDSTVRARFVREGRTLARVAHPHVVEVFDVGEHRGAPYLVMTLVDGDQFVEHFQRRSPVSLVEAVDSILPIVSAVNAAYEAGVVDRDLTPRNIRFAPDHRGDLAARVLDFGVSKLTGDERGDKLLQTSGILKMASYIAPEQLTSTKRPHVRSDVYSLGALLYEAVTGRPPFQAKTAYDLMQAVFSQEITPPSVLREGIGEAFDALVLRAMRREPYERYSSARELGHALAACSSDPEGWTGEFTASSGRRVAAPRASGIQLGKRSKRDE